jgi:FGGY family of carbohydrate kinases, C-terminal domain
LLQTTLPIAQAVILRELILRAVEGRQRRWRHSRGVFTCCPNFSATARHTQITADTTGLTVALPQTEEPVLLGSAILGAIAAGAYRSNPAPTSQLASRGSDARLGGSRHFLRTFGHGSARTSRIPAPPANATTSEPSFNQINKLLSISSGYPKSRKCHPVGSMSQPQ